MKKFLLTLSGIGSIMAPLALTISCNASPVKTETETPKITFPKVKEAGVKVKPVIESPEPVIAAPVIVPVVIIPEVIVPVITPIVIAPEAPITTGPVVQGNLETLNGLYAQYKASSGWAKEQIIAEINAYFLEFPEDIQYGDRDVDHVVISDLYRTKYQTKLTQYNLKLNALKQAQSQRKDLQATVSADEYKLLQRSESMALMDLMSFQKNNVDFITAYKADFYGLNGGNNV